MILLILGSTDLQGQKINDITVNSSNVCAGNEIIISFEVRNGGNNQFTRSTQYTIEFGTGVGNNNDNFLARGVQLLFTADNAPDPFNNASAIITKSFLIPDDTPAGNIYVFRISSQNPNAGGSKKEVSDTFEVFAKPATPSASSNTPICSRGTLMLFANSSETNISYNWTGPNGFNRTNEQNPTINNATAAMSGDYSVSITSTTTECVSSTATISVFIEDENKWNGSVDNDWNNPGNWDCGRIPDLNENVRISGTGIPNYPVLNSGSAGQSKNIILESMASLEVLDNALEISGIISNNGTFNASNGTIEMKGNSFQTIPNNTFLNNRIKNLTINNLSDVSLSGDLEITGILNVENGNLNSAGFLKLISDATQTALIDGNGTGEIIGNVTIQRYIDPAFGYKYISSPFNNSTVGDLESYVNLDASFPLFYEYDENRQDLDGNDATGWSAYTTRSGSLNPGQGYAINMGTSSSAATIEISGIVNNSDYNRRLSNNNGTYTKGFHLVGNPYPSPIDWNATSGWNRTGIDDAIYLFSADNSDQFTGTYSSYVNDISSSGTNSGIIASMQGFFVHVTSTTGGNLGMTNSVRINDFNNHEFIKASASTTPLIRIAAGFENEQLNDPMVIYFDSYASLDFEAELDALKLMNTNKNVPNLYSISANKQKLLSINAISDPVKKNYQKIPLGLSTEKAGDIIFSLKNFDNISENFNVFLIDQERQTSINLKKRDYKVSVGKGQFNTRFFLAFSPLDNISSEEIIEPPFTLMSNQQKINIKMNLLQHENGTIRISAIDGKLIELVPVRANQEITIDGIKSNGVYLVSFTSGNQQYSKKVIVRK
ncbi:T9SS type A sorting domain-containing protein [Christiangramia forsetii]|nr:T9SS type A sorting domain-containing protein [Christiangramia forsetii]GGG42076.1 hypothetical protein GCM10011532_27370 [Christiangramia forsetii]